MKWALFIQDIIQTVFRKLSHVQLFKPMQTIQGYRVQPWFADNGDQTLRLNYELGKDSVVFDLGGYEGKWASDIFCKYSCQMHVFEPVEQYYLNIKQRFSHNKDVCVYHFGLSDKNETTSISISKDSSSTYKSGDASETISLKKFSEFFEQNNFSSVDLIKINIEGGEYDLLEEILASGMACKIKNFQIQFHDFVPDAESRMKSIQAALSKTHELTYQYEFVWENWSIKKRT